MTTLVLITVVVLRFVLPLFIPRFPVPAILACLVIDAVDQTVFQAVSDGVRAVGLAFLPHAVRPILHGLLGPVVFLCSQFLPGLSGLGP